MASIEDTIKARGRKLGFADIRITDAEVPIGRQQAYLDYITSGYHGTMGWLAHDPQRRSSPKNIWRDAQSAIICAMNYGPVHNPLALLEKRQKAAISVYAQNRDYHDIIKGKLKEVAGLLARVSGAEVKVFVDTAPILEKPLAEQAGIGWQGKHTNLVSSDHGSWLFLGEILTSAKLNADAPQKDQCGSCRRCLDICPTNAMPQPYKLDARRCISYLTIEHDGPIDRQYRRAMGNRIYGCDDCLAICPWNKFATVSSELKLKALPQNISPGLETLLDLDDAGFRQRFQGSPVRRIGRQRFIRNVLIACGNSGSARLADAIAHHLLDPSPMIRGAAVWALSQLLQPSAFEAMRATYAANEREQSVIAEWEAAVGA